jgi:hypothetical protein
MKIFGIGLSKTGTMSLQKALELLGFSCTRWSMELLEDVVLKKDFARVFETVKQYDSFRNWPWPLIYKELDKQFPESKFILTLRKDNKTWLRSIKEHVAIRGPREFGVQKLTYGYNSPRGHEHEYIERYERHNREVVDYFRDRPDDLLVVCWENGDGWNRLCSFLNKPIPPKPFPHVNKTSRSLLLRPLYKVIFHNYDKLIKVIYR